jgi:DNA-binding NtrC family response regulator
MLDNLGYNVLHFSKPSEALEILKTYDGDVHLLMTDVVMPEINGRELSRQVAEKFPDIKVLFMSGYTADVIAHHGVLDEDIDFIQKPFTLKDLASKVREILDR